MQAGGFDLGALVQSAQAMQAEMARAQASLGDLRSTGTSGGGLVRAEVDGTGQLLGLTIDPSVVDPDDVETLADLVVAAVRDGVRAAEALARESMGSVAGGLMGSMGLPNLPSLPDLSGLPGFPGAPEPSDDFDDSDDVGDFDVDSGPDDADAEG